MTVAATARAGLLILVIAGAPGPPVVVSLAVLEAVVAGDRLTLRIFAGARTVGPFELQLGAPSDIPGCP